MTASASPTMTSAEATSAASRISHLMMAHGFDVVTGPGVTYGRRWPLQNEDGHIVGVVTVLVLFEPATAVQTRPRWAGFSYQWQTYIPPEKAVRADWPRLMPVEVEVLVCELAGQLAEFADRSAALDRRVCVRCGQVTSTFAPQDDGAVCVPACR